MSTGVQESPHVLGLNGFDSTSVHERPHESWGTTHGIIPSLIEPVDPGNVSRSRRRIDGSATNLHEAPALFAYSNGNWTTEAEHLLVELGYESAVLFDHRVAHPGNPLRLSRTRVNADDDMDTFRARVSGIHPAIHRLRSLS